MIVKPRGIIFDWDNTLVDTKSAIDIAISTMFEKMNVDFSKFDKNDPKNFLSAKDSLPLVFGDRWQEANQIYRETYLKHRFDKINLLENAQEVLDLLRKNSIYIAIVSNKLGSMLREEVTHFGLDDYFAKIIGSLDAKEDKPSKEPVLLALDGSDIEPSYDVWFVGDSEIDMQCAINSSLKPVLLGEAKISNFKNVKAVKNHRDFYYLLNELI